MKEIGEIFAGILKSIENILGIVSKDPKAYKLTVILLSFLTFFLIVWSTYFIYVRLKRINKKSKIDLFVKNNLEELINLKVLMGELKTWMSVINNKL